MGLLGWLFDAQVTLAGHPQLGGGEPCAHQGPGGEQLAVAFIILAAGKAAKDERGGWGVGQRGRRGWLAQAEVDRPVGLTRELGRVLQKAVPGVVANAKKQIDAPQQQAGERVVAAPRLDAKQHQANVRLADAEERQQLEQAEMPDQHAAGAPAVGEGEAHGLGL